MLYHLMEVILFATHKHNLNFLVKMIIDYWFQIYWHVKFCGK